MHKGETMKTSIAIALSFFLAMSVLRAESHNPSKVNAHDLKTIEKIAKGLRRSLAVTWSQRQKAVERGLETKFDSAFGEAELLVDNLFREINHFHENQNSPPPSKKDSRPLTPERLNGNMLRIIAHFQTLMEHLQNTLRDTKSIASDEGLAPYIHNNTSNRVKTGPSSKGRRARKQIKKRLLDDPDSRKPTIRYEISGTQIDMPKPEDEAFIH